MSEVREFRLRLDSRELQFLIRCLRHTLSFLEVKEKEYKQLEAKVHSLRRELRYNTTRWKEYKETKEQLNQWGNFEMKLLQYRNLCNRMIRRLEKVLNGGKPHRYDVYGYNLRQLMS